MLDALFLAATAALFALVALVAEGGREAGTGAPFLVAPHHLASGSGGSHP
ncbi:hypothetical protein [Microbacterium trichothecenolyticum]|uniref:Uncharacterized protein n=1 Tax=Microbacterium trichothecenolyticum TaxID=69370 RepID=A0ABU0TXX3_MICTR|nr:hypothetical protein [Microbacterium trichothecenolyticum]MDQ1123812.1 hypothetical protein [Microbacterium trichothecenolyticum]